MTKIYTLSRYKEFDSAYWGLGWAQNGLVYFGLCTHRPNMTAGLFCFDPKFKKISKIFNLSEILPRHEAPFQGKIHTSIYSDNKNNIYFGSHFAYPNGIPQNVDYSGGHIFAYNTAKNKITDFGIAVPREGILSMTFDKNKQIIYCLTAPSGYFISLNLDTRKYKNHGRAVKEGSICRSIVLDKKGNVYGSLEKNKIFMFDTDSKTLKILDLVLPYNSSTREWSSPSRGGVNKIGRNIWRAAVFDKETTQIFGIHAAYSSLFNFNPLAKRIANIGYFIPRNYKKNFDNIYPTLSLSVYKNSLFYTPASGFFDYSRSENIEGFSHLMKYSISSDKIADEGIVRDKNSRKVYGVAGSTMSQNGTYYMLGAVEVFDGESYNNQNVIQGKPYHLGLISIQNKNDK
jgi:hypothetical protein